MKLINIGFGNMVSASRLVAVVSPESAPIKRMITDARDNGQLVDATYGRRTRAVIITDSGHIILSAVQPETVAGRLNDKADRDTAAEDEDEYGICSERPLRLRHGDGTGSDQKAAGRVLLRISHHERYAPRRDRRS